MSATFGEIVWKTISGGYIEDMLQPYVEKITPVISKTVWNMTPIGQIESILSIAGKGLQDITTGKGDGVDSVVKLAKKFITSGIEDGEIDAIDTHENIDVDSAENNN